MAAVIFNSTQLLKQPSGIIGVAFVRLQYSTEKSYNVASMKRGTGGRSSFSGIVATVFGATGFVGRYVCNRLGKIGSQIIIPYRGEPYFVRRLKLAGDLGQVLFQPYELRDEASIEKAMKYSNVVINLTGRDYETKRYKFEDVHVTGARTLARIAKNVGVERFIHFSALNACKDPKPVVMKKGSRFFSSKFDGEEAVRSEFPEATIFRPADIYGQEDRFLKYYAHAWRHSGRLLPLWKKGLCTIKQPVYIGDVAAAVVAAVKDPDTAGQLYQAVGPKRFYLSDLVDWLHAVMKKDTPKWGYRRYDMRWDPIFPLKVAVSNMTPSYPLANLHWDRIEREHVTDEVIGGVPTLEDLGINLTPIENQVPWELRSYTAAIYYRASADEPYPQPPPPKAAI